MVSRPRPSSTSHVPCQMARQDSAGVSSAGLAAWQRWHDVGSELYWQSLRWSLLLRLARRPEIRARMLWLMGMVHLRQLEAIPALRDEAGVVIGRG